MDACDQQWTRDKRGMNYVGHAPPRSPSSMPGHPVRALESHVIDRDYRRLTFNTIPHCDNVEYDR
jgi:hypothetical protein